MYSKDMPLIIERVGNGYQVMPMIGQNQVMAASEIMVFQDKGFAAPSRDNQQAESTLFGWLDQHFTDAKQ